MPVALLKPVHGLPNASAKAYFTLLRLLAEGGNAAFVTEDEEEAADFLDALKALHALAGDKFPLSTFFIGSDESARSAALFHIAEEKKRGAARLCAAITAENLALALAEEGAVAASAFSIDAGEDLPRTELLRYLDACGYQRAEFVESTCEYAVRGSVVDIFTADPERAVRLYFAGNRAESIRVFDIETQEAKETLENLFILPAKTAAGKIPLPKWLGDSFQYLVSPPKVTADEQTPPWLALLPQDRSFAASFFPAPDGNSFGATENISFQTGLSVFADEARRLRATGNRVVIACTNRGEQERLEELLAGTQASNFCELAIGRLNEGFIHKDSNLAVIASGELLNRRYSSSRLIRKFDRSSSRRIRFKDLKAGDFVVHEDYGVGRYMGLRAFPAEGQGEMEGETIDCLTIEYKNSHKLFVPLYDFKKVAKYVGGEGRAPRLAALDTKTWTEVKARVKKGVEEIARELLKLEAGRAAVSIDPLFGDPRIEREFAESFPYEETPDQTAAIQAVLADLSSPKPMDRVLAGDVGFGKTEVAMRAALRATASGKQTLILVPTTILAAQHYRTFKNRLAGFPANVAMLCRFQTREEQKKVVEDIKNGVADIVVGTHRLMSKDIIFRRLGLCVIDEEHRFGVKQKEKIKAIARGVHTLMMSATPIPRTLNQAMSSLRSISVIETPPEGRMPISTRVMPYEETAAASAIREEVGRGGQVYYVYNKVKTLPTKLAELKKLMPEIKFGMAHGQMPEAQLERAMWEFFNRQFDVLVASTIIESGLDLPQANTMIVDDAHDFGLSQLYQLRGRIGRGAKKAFCYLFYPSWLKDPSRMPPPDDFEEEAPRKRKKRAMMTQFGPMTEEACQRLSALMEFSELGSGFRLAMRDLEIRGAGELLGTRQHGFMNEVGLTLYCDLLNSEVRRMKGGQAPPPLLASFEARVSAHIPEKYLPDENERLTFYRRLLGSDPAAAAKALTEMENMAGPAPEPVKNLVRIMEVRAKAATLGIRHIEETGGALEVYFRKGSEPPSGSAAKLMKKYAARLEFLPSPIGDGIKIQECADPLALSFEILQLLGN